MPLTVNLSSILFERFGLQSLCHSFSSIFLHLYTSTLISQVHSWSSASLSLCWGPSLGCWLSRDLNSGQPYSCPTCYQLSYAAPYVLYDASSLAWPHPVKLRRTLLSYAAPYWATPHPPELSRTLLSYATPSRSLHVAIWLYRYALPGPPTLSYIHLSLGPCSPHYVHPRRSSSLQQLSEVANKPSTALLLILHLSMFLNNNSTVLIFLWQKAHAISRK